MEDMPCYVPECHGGTIRVPVIRTETRYGSKESYAYIEEVDCGVCKGQGTLTSHV